MKVSRLIELLQEFERSYGGDYPVTTDDSEGDWRSAISIRRAGPQSTYCLISTGNFTESTREAVAPLAAIEFQRTQRDKLLHHPLSNPQVSQSATLKPE